MAGEAGREHAKRLVLRPSGIDDELKVKALARRFDPQSRTAGGGMR